MSSEQQITEQQVIATYRGMRSEIKQLADKLAELELDLNEHTRVIETLTPLDASRKAYRMIGGVLVERSVGEVLPAVSSNKEGIVQVINQLSATLKEKETAAQNWQRKYNIRTQKEA